jgi:hypothetical protein
LNDTSCPSIRVRTVVRSLVAIDCHSNIPHDE